MKNYSKILLGLILSGTLVFSSCKDDDEDYEMTKTEFASHAASSNMLEIQLSTLAKTRATTPAVKAYAQMMETDHGKASTELAALATAEGVQLPTTMIPAHQTMVSSLASSNLQGVAFDKAYMTLMVQSHQEAVNLFDEAEDEVDDAEFRAFADNKLPVLQHHLEAAITLNNSLNP